MALSSSSHKVYVVLQTENMCIIGEYIFVAKIPAHMSVSGASQNLQSDCIVPSMTPRQFTSAQYSASVCSVVNVADLGPTTLPTGQQPEASVVGLLRLPMQQYYIYMLVGLCTTVFNCTLQHLAEVGDHHDEVQNVHPFEFAMMALSTVAHVIMSSQHNLTVFDITKTFTLLVWSVCGLVRIQADAAIDNYRSTSMPCKLLKAFHSTKA